MSAGLAATMPCLTWEGYLYVEAKQQQVLLRHRLQQPAASASDIEAEGLRFWYKSVNCVGVIPEDSKVRSCGF